MSIKKMEYDNWINSLSNDTEIENPTWEQVEKAIKSLDADQHTMVILTSDTQSLISRLCKSQMREGKTF